MASKIKGITIEIEGNTTKLNDALKTTNKIVYSTNSELKALNNALKLDPKNTELLCQKQELLKKNISETTNRLNMLKEAQRQMGNYNSLTEEQKENYRTLSVEISKSESAIKKMNSELKKTGSINLEKVGETLKKIGSIAGEVVKKVGQVALGASTALAGVVAAGVKSYADLEQNIGGVETLFGDSAQKVIDNSKKAYETAGVSANEYMAGVTSFSASLLQSLGGDTSKAADIADMAFKDMSDNANKFGTDMSSIQNAYQGFAKQNYTMLDNLKLGYGGTKTEMERLLSDAEKISGVKYDISNLSDVYNAIHVIQEKMEVTGTTAKESATTISGSATSMKAAFDNFLNGSGSPEQLSGTITNFINNVINAITKLAPNILTGITTLIETLVPQIGTLLINLLPQLLVAAQNMLNSLFNMISKNVQPIADMTVKLVTSLVNFILQNLPLIIKTGLEIIIALATGISDSLPELIPTIVDVILDIVNILLDNIDEIIEAGIKILVGLTEGIMNALPRLVSRLPEIIIKITNTLINLSPQLFSAALRIIMALAEGLIKYIPEIISRIPQIIKSMINAFKQGFGDFINIGKNLLKGIWEGISNTKDWLVDKIKGIGKTITSAIKKVFGIHSPSTIMRDQIGLNLGKGIGVGFEKSIPEVLKNVNSAMSDLNTGIQASVNPIINPTANTNPLILNIENFNNTRNTDIQQLAEELEFYRKNNALAKGDV
jgi:phage-related protein